MIDGNGSPAISKAQAVRNALGEGLEDLGDIEGFVKSRHGIDIPRQMISAYKAMEKKRAEKKSDPKRKPRSGEPAAPRKSLRSGEMDVLEVLEAMKPLVEAFGAEKVKRLVDLLG
ncbi:hypothetical protein [Paludisphaera soli]|uniref:hypothetical protein n=1 Tax=Paludisphaera soli TaxID=2712865 RepID=UPI0013EC229B|nr:hypothetical protein [Paludisphaera soli]